MTVKQNMDNNERVRLETVLVDMQIASDEFYRSAVAINNHPFIEFAGLMNEYIKLCREALKQGIDFTQASTHTGVALPFQAFHIAYLGDKLDCIYGPSIAQLLMEKLTNNEQQAA